MNRIAAAILAGGRGERLGGANKALLDLGGKSLLARALAAIEGANPILLCAGGNVFDSGTGIAADRTLPDLAADYGGPLAGVAAAVEHLEGSTSTLLLTLAVDTPFFPADFMTRATAALEGFDAVFAAFEGQIYPTNALWRQSALAPLPGRVRAGTAPRSLKRLGEERRITLLDYAAFGAENPFANLNTPQDQAELEQRLQFRMRELGTTPRDG